METTDDFEVKIETENIVSDQNNKKMINCYFCNLEFEEDCFLEHQNIHVKVEEGTGTVLYTIEELSDFQANEELGVYGAELEKTVENGKEPWITYCLPDFLPESDSEIGPDLSITPQAKKQKVLQPHPTDRSKNQCWICGLMYASHYAMAKHAGKNHNFYDYLKLVKSQLLKDTLAKHTCPCSMSFLNDADLQRHCLIHQKNFNVLIKCSMCLHSFSDGVHVKAHVCPVILDKILWKQEQEERKKSNPIFKCAECSATFDSIINFKHHKCRSQSEESSEIPRNSQQVFKCFNCSQNFSSINEVKDHECISNQQSTESNSKLFRCPKCPDKKFLKQAMFIEHLKISHKINEESENLEVEIPPQDAAIKNGIKYLQKYLEEKQGEGEILEAEPIIRNSKKSKSKKSHSPVNDIFNCPNCVEVFSSLSKFQKHLAVHESVENGYWSKDLSSDQNSFRTVIQCPRCPEKFLKQIFFLEHIKVIHGGQVINQGEENIRIILNSIQQSSSNQEEMTEYNMVPTVSPIENGWMVYQKYIAENQESLPLDVELKVEESSDSEINQEILGNTQPNQEESLTEIKEEKTYKCSSCLEGYSDTKELKNHMITHQQQESETSYVRIQVKDKNPVDIEVQDNLMVCTCKMAFLGLSDLKTHLIESDCASQSDNEIIRKRRKLSQNEADADLVILDFIK